MEKQLGPTIKESTKIKCKNCGNMDIVSEFWRLSRHPLEEKLVVCICDRVHTIAVIFPDGKVELNSAQAEVVN